MAPSSRPRSRAESRGALAPTTVPLSASSIGVGRAMEEAHIGTISSSLPPTPAFTALPRRPASAQRRNRILFGIPKDTTTSSFGTGGGSNIGSKSGAGGCGSSCSSGAPLTGFSASSSSSTFSPFVDTTTPPRRTSSTRTPLFVEGTTTSRSTSSSSVAASSPPHEEEDISALQTRLDAELEQARACLRLDAERVRTSALEQELRQSYAAALAKVESAFERRLKSVRRFGGTEKWSRRNDRQRKLPKKWRKPMRPLPQNWSTSIVKLIEYENKRFSEYSHS
ncbi:unnamed protein product [Amoebophrya sp. A25]|nr:unnamed protein product [Amoebophrya sp. A25]|eukprot:GSA25T00002591001.1